MNYNYNYTIICLYLFNLEFKLLLIVNYVDDILLNRD